VAASSEALGAAIRRRREALRPVVSQRALGEAAGYGGGANGAAVALSRIEAGRMRPSKQRLGTIAAALGVSVEDLVAEAERDERRFKGRGNAHGTALGGRSLKQRTRAVQVTVAHRTTLAVQLAETFTAAQDAARQEFRDPFRDDAALIRGAPAVPSPEALDGPAIADPAVPAQYRLAFASSAGPGAVGSPRSRRTVRGVGVAGGAVLVAGLVAGPAAVLAVGGLVWMTRRSKQKDRELGARLDAAEAELAATQRGFDTLVDAMRRGSSILEYVSLHAAHAERRWRAQLPDGPLSWAALSEDHRRAFGEFLTVVGCVDLVSGLDLGALLMARGEDLDLLVETTEQDLLHAQATIEALV
jgi:transcriptional regulator with XRE-family HTH domain